MTKVGRAVHRTFHSMRTRNFRLYLFGQVVSVTGTWMQAVALAWLVLRLTGSAVDLGLVTALQFAPTLVLGTLGGVAADRFDKRLLLVGTQAAFAALALALGVMTVAGTARLGVVYVLALLQGLVTALDTPTRQSFVAEMVGPKDLTNAVSLNSAVMTGTRIVGPAVAGVLIATVGLAPVFLVNGVSYLAVIGALAAMRTEDLHRPERASDGQAWVRDGFRYVWRTPELRSPLLLMAVLFTLSFNFSVLIPLLAEGPFHGGAGTFGSLMSMMGVGSFVGALVLAHRSRPSRRAMTVAALALGVLSLVAAAAPTLGVELALMLLIGGASIAFMVNGNSTLQLTSAPDMRGRVMALYSIVFLGTTPIGAPLAGFVAERLGPRFGLGAGGAAAVVVASVALVALRRERETAVLALADSGTVDERALTA